MGQALKNRLQLVQKTARQKTGQLVAGVATLASTGMASAQSAFSVNVTPLTDGIDQVFTAVGTIGPAIVLVWLAIKAYKWIRAALS